MRPLGACGRADLVRALASGDPNVMGLTAEMLGYAPPRAKTKQPSATSTVRTQLESSEEPLEAAQPVADTPFWRVEHFALVELADTKEQPLEPVEIRWHNRPNEAPPIYLLAPWRELQPRLRRQAAQASETRALDVDAVVRHLSRGHQLARIPHERRLRWGPRLQIIADRSERLVPFWTDQEVIGQAVAALLPADRVEQAAIWEGLTQPRLLAETSAERAYRIPPPGSLVLVLGDLGCLAGGDDRLHRQWVDFGRRLADSGCRRAALLPFAPGRCHHELRSEWRVLPWGRGDAASVNDPGHLRRRAERLLRLVSPALRIEPGFLRAVRRLLPTAEADAGTEADVWQHPAVRSTSAAGATLDPEEAKRLRAAFADEPPELQRQVLALLRVWRGSLPQELWFEEIQCLAPASRALLPEPEDLSLARRFFEQLSQQSRGIVPGGVSAGVMSWYRRCEHRLTASAWSDGVVGQALHRLSWTLHGRDGGYQPAEAFTPALVPPSRAQRLALSQRGAKLHAEEQTDPAALAPIGSPLAGVWSNNGLVQIQAVAALSERPNDFWEVGQPPSWADAWGWDEFGAWTAFSAKGKDGQWVTQRMRWIEPGTFLMGSPADELERYQDEGPRHRVTIEQGYWLFDTACTQALWQAVVGKDPSRFQGSGRPVENVRWDDAQRFIQALNERLPALDLGLPSEAQWEYACRAGTTTPFSFGDGITPEQVNYHGNYPYAGGEKGLYRRETLPVKSLPPNAWGLHEMHGNVWEWVQDNWHDDYAGAPVDGSAWETAAAGAGRVIRGGSWFSVARRCRSAYRYRFGPDFRSYYLGFRCARVQGRGPGQQETERARPQRPGPRSGTGRAAAGPAREAGGGTGRTSVRQGAAQSVETDVGLQPDRHLYGQAGPQRGLLRLDTATEGTVALPSASAFLIATDRERLIVRRTEKPAWASGMGRDHFGLWSEIAVEPGTGEPIIQRLRWIPPGWFLMGSPADEPGRWQPEGPQHRVTITQGYWLFDTPCTQALWEAVMGENPSRFQDPERPVETVSWDEVQARFLPALNARIPGFALPSEAQWEYACRAGTETALYTGPIEIRGDMDAPALDPIAWYGGNSGVDFDLEEGEDSTQGWWKGKRKQYEHKRAGTRQVKGKQSNAWGLYDMLGNVWEWVQDPWHDPYEGAPEDGSVWESDAAGAGRVIRGGSWSSGARNCRSAFRGHGGPDDRYGYLGFRCARVQL